VSFEWDPNKAAANSRKHGAQFTEAIGALSDAYAITINDDESGENIRMISARTPERPEREQYEAQR
jgi:uncharacterized DUF497 family protein